MHEHIEVGTTQSTICTNYTYIWISNVPMLSHQGICSHNDDNQLNSQVNLVLLWIWNQSTFSCTMDEIKDVAEYINGLPQCCRNSISNALELLSLVLSHQYMLRKLQNKSFFTNHRTCAYPLFWSHPMSSNMPVATNNEAVIILIMRISHGIHPSKQSNDTI